MAPNELYSGVQLIHSNNKVYTTMEGYASNYDISKINELPYNGAVQEYANLNPGMYKVNINGTLYALLIHDTLSGSDKLTITNNKNAYAIVDNKRYNLILYKINEAKEIQSAGYVMNHSINDSIDLLVIDGLTKFNPINGTTSISDINFSNYGTFNFISMLNIKVSNKTGKYEQYVFNLKNYIKSIKYRSTQICDTVYLEAYKNKVLFIFRTGRLIFTGYETFELLPEYSNDYSFVFRFNNTLVKENAIINCSHIKYIEWDKLVDRNYYNSGICAGIEGQPKGFYFKINKNDFYDIESFKGNLGKLGLTVLYELAQPSYKHIPLSNYKINTFYNTSWIAVNPYKNLSNNIVYPLNSIVGVISKNNIIKSVIEQINESGNPEYYEAILTENNIFRNIGIRNNDTGIIEYDTIDEEELWNKLISIGAIKPYDKIYLYDSHFIAALPKDSIIKSEEYHLQQSGIEEEYDTIIVENDIWEDLITTGDLEITMMYFYKHLRINN